MAVEIDSRAIVEKGAILGENVKVGPYAVIGSGVVLGDETVVASHAVVSGQTTLGRGCEVSSFATVGVYPQHRSYLKKESQLICGDYNVFREYCNISTGTPLGDNRTVIGSHNFFMCHTHVGHDCRVGSYSAFANHVTLAGHVTVGDYIVFGGHSAFHQFTRVGSYSMIGGGSMVAGDVVPFILAEGDRAKARGVNVVGLTRNNFSKEAIYSIKKAYKTLFRSNLTMDEAVKRIKADTTPSDAVDLLLNFLSQESRRGFAR